MPLQKIYKKLLNRERTRAYQKSVTAYQTYQNGLQPSAPYQHKHYSVVLIRALLAPEAYQNTLTPPTYPFKKQAVALKNKMCFNGSVQQGGAAVEEDGATYETIVVKCERSQLCDSLVQLAQSVDLCRDAEARAFLLQAMSSIAYELNPPKGELCDIKKLK